MPGDKIIKKIDISNNDTPDEHELAGKYIQETNDKSTISGLKTWADILELLEAGFEAVKLTTLPTPSGSTTWAQIYSTYHNCIVFIPKDPQPASGNDNCDEYIIQRTGTDPNYTYAWEHIGSTDVDLSGYVQKGTYTTDAANGDTGSAGAQTITVSISNQDAVSKTATITYDKATDTGSTGSDSETENTNNAGGHTVQGSNFIFNGTTATLTPKTKIKKHTIAAHSHTVNLDGDNVTIVTGVKSSGGTTTVVTSVSPDGTAEVITGAIKDVSLELTSTTPSADTITVVYGIEGSAPSMQSGTGYTSTVVYGMTGFSGGSLTGTQTFVTGYNSFYGGALKDDTTFFNGATVDANNVLKFAKGTVGLSPASLGNASTASVSFSAATFTFQTAKVGVTGGSYTPQIKYLKKTNIAADAKATVLTGVKAGGTANVILANGLTSTSKTIITSATLDTNGAVTLEHEAPAAGAATTTYNEVSGEGIAYAPAGTIGGSQVISGHSHTYIKLPAHTHSVNTTPTDISFQVSVPIDHSHTINVSNHTHTLGNHTHNITFS